MAAIKDIYELESLVNEYMERHGMKLKKSSRDIVSNVYKVNTMDYNYLESKLITMKNGKTRVVFKINGRVSSLYK